MGLYGLAGQETSGGTRRPDNKRYAVACEGQGAVPTNPRGWPQSHAEGETVDSVPCDYPQGGDDDIAKRPLLLPHGGRGAVWVMREENQPGRHPAARTK